MKKAQVHQLGERNPKSCWLWRMSQETRGGPGLIHATLQVATGLQVPGVHVHPQSTPCPQERGGQDQEPGPMRN